MGVSLEVRRCRIGRLHPLRPPSGLMTLQDHHFTKTGLTLAVFFSLLLLLSGDVEANPSSLQAFMCTFCSMVFYNVQYYCDHQLLHFSTKNFRFPCALPSSDETFPSVGAYRTHITRFHCDSGVKYHPFLPVSVALAPWSLVGSF